MGLATPDYAHAESNQDYLKLEHPQSNGWCGGQQPSPMAGVVVSKGKSSKSANSLSNDYNSHFRLQDVILNLRLTGRIF